MYAIGGISCSTNGYKRADLKRALEGIAAAGFRSVEIAAIPGHCAHVDPDTAGSREVSEASRLMASLGLQPVSLSGHMSLIDPKAIEKMRRRIDLAVALGVRFVNTGTGDVGEDPSQRRLFFRNIEQAGRYAEKAGILVCLETHGGLTGSARECLDTLASIQSPAIRINYDTANVIYYRGVKPEEDIRLVADRIAHVHLKDKRGGQGVYDFPPIGDGEIDFPRVLSTLWDSGYRGPLSLEIELQEGATDSQEDAALVKTYRYLETILR